jgi:hypothetical protein
MIRLYAGTTHDMPAAESAGVGHVCRLQEALHLLLRYELRQLAVLLVQRPVFQLAVCYTVPAAVQCHAAAA